MQQTKQFGSWQESFFLSGLLIVVLWLFFWAEHVMIFDFYELGLKPRSLKGLLGVIFMPLIHDRSGFEHIFNNSVPLFFMFAALIYYYRSIAFKVFFYTWILSGLILWTFAWDNRSVHIGISGLVYALASFLFTSGVLRKFLPLQAISLFLVFVYGSMVWGLFPIKEKISWEGHLIGFVLGIMFAFIYRKQGPQRTKYQFEIEKELGIEPPDLEGMWLQRQQEIEVENQRIQAQIPTHIIYHYMPSTKEAPEDDKKIQ